MLRIKLAFKNILRHPIRSIMNVCMIAGAFSAIVIFKGFSNRLMYDLRMVNIDTQYGHFQIAKKDFWDRSLNVSKKNKVILNSANLVSEISKIPTVDYASGRLFFYGLVSGGELTTNAAIIGFDDKVERAALNAYKIKIGTTFSGAEDELIMGHGLHKQIKIPVGEYATILTNTLGGVMNALDLKLVGVYQTGVSEVDDQTIVIPLKTAQKLLDTDGVERLVVRMKSERTKNSDQSQLESIVSSYNKKENEFPLKVRYWEDLADFYGQVRDYLLTQNLVISGIIMALVFISVSNTIGMSVFERTGEIGTARALGDSPKDLIIQFVIEGCILVFISCLVGVVVTFMVAEILTMMKIEFVSPGASVPLLMRFEFTAEHFISSIALCFFTGVIATMIPTYRATRIQIVEALRKNV